MMSWTSLDTLWTFAWLYPWDNYLKREFLGQMACKYSELRYLLQLWMQCSIAQLYLTLCDPMDCSWPGSSLHGIFQERIVEQVAIFYSRKPSCPRDGTPVSCTGRWLLYHSATRTALLNYTFPKVTIHYSFTSSHTGFLSKVFRPSSVLRRSLRITCC